MYSRLSSSLSLRGAGAYTLNGATAMLEGPAQGSGIGDRGFALNG